jgi:hypothetical protein
MNLEPFDKPDPLEARLLAMRPADLPPELEESLAWPRVDSEKPGVAATHDLHQPSDLRVFVPIEERSTLVDVQDLGLVETIPTRPVRVLRYTWIDDTTFRGDDGHSTLRRTQPREQIVPVVLQAF